MTEYGRGQGSEPWHPDDPYYGDGGWGGQQAQMGQQSPYGGQPQHYPEQPQQPQYGNWGDGLQDGYGQAQQQYPYDQQYVAQPQQQHYDNGGWATGTQQHVPYPTDPSDPYGQQGYGGEQPDYYGTPDAHPPPEPPHGRRAEPEPHTDWDPGPDQGEHAFFTGGGDDDEADDEDGRGRGSRRGKGGKPKKRRNGCACLMVALVLGGGVATVGYFGYQYYQDHFTPPPDYAGDGTNTMVTVQIPKGAGGYDIGRRLKEAGVVKSVDAFVAAQQANPRGKTIQAGAYLLHKQMSARSAVEMMLDPKSQNNVMVTPGQRNIQVYDLIDAKLGLSSGTTRKIAEKKYASLGLPSWANDNSDIKDPLEGFLYPGTYPAAKGMKPETVLKEMVSEATKKYGEYDLAAKAKALKLDNPLQVVTVASLVQAEGTSHDDFRKMAEVVYNRLKPGNPQTYGSLEFDSTYNYVKNQSKIDLTIAELRQYDNPYNTYFVKGLPPGPIDNPGEEALKGALNPTHEGWYYFISLNGKTSMFTKTLAEHNKLVQQFNASRNKD